MPEPHPPRWRTFSVNDQTKSRVKIVAQYHNYTPPVDVYRSVRVLLKYVPAEHLAGLRLVVLTNSEEVGKRIRGKILSDKDRVRPADCVGLYSQGRVLLLVDRILAQYSEGFFLFPLFKTYVIAEVLYHEIGHHIHRLQQPGYRADKETFAEEWKEKLLQRFLIQRYWYFAKLMQILRPVINPIALRLKRTEQALGTDSP